MMSFLRAGAWRVVAALLLPMSLAACGGGGGAGVGEEHLRLTVAVGGAGIAARFAGWGGTSTCAASSSVSDASCAPKGEPVRNPAGR